jgi:hypothetical protein
LNSINGGRFADNHIKTTILQTGLFQQATNKKKYMAKFNSTTFGAISGRHGSAVAATTKDGKSYLRVYRAPSDPKSTKQVAQRTKFAFANSSLSCFRNLFKETFNNRRGLNMGVSYALKKQSRASHPTSR